MFSATLTNGTTVRFSFSFDSYIDPLGHNHRTTMCYADDDSRHFYVVSCSHLDKFTRSGGRKNALAGLLEYLNYSRADRAIVWNEYFKVAKRV